jgi:excisionase family DNA binding protein
MPPAVENSSDAIRSRTVSGHLDPLVVSPREARRLLAIGNTHLYALIANGELASYRDGRSRRITMESIRHRITRLLTAASATGAPTETDLQPRRRGRPRKLPENEARA